VSIVKKLLGESNATAFHPEKAAAFVEEFRNGKRILVLTATQAELVAKREDLRQFKGPFVAFRISELLSADYVKPADKPINDVKIGGNTYKTWLTQDVIDRMVAAEEFTQDELLDTEYMQDRIDVWEDNMAD